MSYDYNELVTSLATHRSNAAAAKESGNSAKYMEHIQEGLQVYDTLSGHCPMTPLLWMQYAFDVSELMASLGGSTGNKNGSATSKAARQTRLETLELGLNEFPGSAVLQLHYCELLVENLLLCNNTEETEDEAEERKAAAQKALLKALQQVGHGSHRNEGDIIAQLYRLHAFFAAQIQSSQDVALASWLQRARTPMDDANDSLMEEVRDFCSGNQQAVNISTNTLQQEFLPALEEARRWEAKTFSQLRSCEDEVTMAMHQEGIAWKGRVDFSPPPPSSDSTTTNISFPFVTTTAQFKESVLVGKSTEKAASQRYYWNGCGGAATAQAFLQYSAACRKFRFPNDSGDTENINIDKDDVDGNGESEEDLKQKHQTLILSVFERGVADCPTVEGLWLAYLKHLTWLWNNAPDQAPSPQAFKDVTTRAVRNCPFSLSLAQQQIHVTLLLVNQNGDSEFVMDPEELLQLITKALDSKFLPNPSHTFDLFTTAIRVIQRRILFLLAKSALGYDPHSKAKKKLPTVLNFDDAELTPSRIPKQKKNSDAPMPVATPLDDETWTEVQDLCEEMRDMFDEAMKRLNKDHASWTEGRALLHQEWAQMERLVVAPLSCITSPSNVGTNHLGENGGDGHDPLSHLEKAIRLHNPPHPDAYRSLIQHVLNHGASINFIPAASRSPGDVVSRLRQVRGLYQKAIHSVGRARVKDATIGPLTVTSTSVLRDFETAFACLCHDYQEFERLFGSEQSLADATRLMQKKIQKTTHRRNNQHTADNAQQQPSGELLGETLMDIDQSDSRTSSQTKRKASGAEAATDQDPPAKKRKTETGEGEETAEETPKMQPGQHHRVQVGNVLHRAHPYTVRISNLAVKTGEMDLVETFRHKHNCGHMVHVKVMREKAFHAKGKEAKHGVSKGWALLQFEERASVEKIIDLDGKVELHDKTLKIERSHVPAAGLVPPGMHRVGSKKKKDQEQPQGDSQEDTKDERDVNKTEIQAPSKPATGSKKPAGILAFRPRGVGSKKQRPKPKLDLA